MKKLYAYAISLLAVAAFGHPAQTVNASSFTPGDKQIIEQLFVAWNSGDPDKVAACFAEDAVYEDVAAGLVHRGKAEVRKWAAGAFRDIADFKIEVVKSSLHRDGAVVEWVWSGTDKGLLKTGKSFSVRGVSVIDVRGGKVVGYKEYYDFATVMRQLGVLPDAKE